MNPLNYNADNRQYKLNCYHFFKIWNTLLQSQILKRTGPVLTYSQMRCQTAKWTSRQTWMEAFISSVNFFSQDTKFKDFHESLLFTCKLAWVLLDWKVIMSSRRKVCKTFTVGALLWRRRGWLAWRRGVCI